MMRYPRAFLLVLCLAVFGVATSYADSLTENFNVPWWAPNTTVTSAGQVTFSLNANGTIAASLVDYNGLIGFMTFNSPTSYLPQSDFSPSTDLYVTQSITVFGFQPSGFEFLDFSNPAGPSIMFATGTVTWTIGNPGDYTSVWQALGGNLYDWTCNPVHDGCVPGSQVDFVLYDSHGYWGAGYPVYQASATPEPGSFILFGTGAMALVGAIRRKFAV